MLQPGDTLDRYTVQGELGRGGMGVVFRAAHRTLGGSYALKVIHLDDPDAEQLVLAEGQLQAAIRHPNVAMVTDILDSAHGPVLVMEFIDGPDLKQWVKATRPPLDARLEVFDGVVQGVAAAHAHGLVHRDIKPGNVLLAMGRDHPFPKVTDFGLARRGAPARSGGQGRVFGTPGYMSPEQLRDSDAVDARADVFSLGCLLYELCCDRRPFRGEDRSSLLAATNAGDYPDPAALAPDLPVRVVTAIRGCLEPDLRRRIPSCEVLREVLQTGQAWSPSAPSGPGARLDDTGDDTWWDNTFSVDKLEHSVRIERRREDREAQLRKLIAAPLRRPPPEIEDREAWRQGLVPDAWQKPERAPEVKPAGMDREKKAIAVAALGVFLGAVAILLWLTPPPDEETPLEAAGQAVEQAARQGVDELTGDSPVEEAAAEAPKPAPRPTTGSLSIEFAGRESKVCVQGERCYGAGKVPAGSYPVWVMDKKAGSFEAGTVDIPAGGAVTLWCDVDAKRCEVM